MELVENLLCVLDNKLQAEYVRGVISEVHTYGCVYLDLGSWLFLLQGERQTI